jgi:hypothetical protein
MPYMMKNGKWQRQGPLGVEGVTTALQMETNLTSKVAEFQNVRL